MYLSINYSVFYQRGDELTTYPLMITTMIYQYCKKLLRVSHNKQNTAEMIRFVVDILIYLLITTKYSNKIQESTRYSS